MQAAMVPCCASTTEDVTAIVRKDIVTIVVGRKVVRAVMLKFLWARIAPRLIANSGGGFYLYQTPTNRLVDVRFGSKADICSAKRHVRFTPESGHLQCNSPCPPWAKSGHRAAHSITSSARASRVVGTSRPRASAALRLITNSYLVGTSTGRSPGFSPLRMRST